MTMKRKKQLFTYKHTILSYLLILTLFPTLVLGAYSYNTYMTEVSDKVALTTKGTAEQTCANVDGILLSIRRYYMGIVMEDDITWLLSAYMDYSQYSYLKKAIDAIIGSPIIMDYVKSYAFINFKTNWVLSNRGMFRYSQVSNQEEVEEVFNYKAGDLERSFWRYQENSEKNLDTKREQIYLEDLCLIYKLPVVKKTTYGMLVVNVNMETLEKMLLQNLPTGDITVYDSEGRLIFTTNREISDDLLEPVLKGQDGSYKITAADGKDYMIATSNSKILDWTYVVSYDWSIVQQEATNILSLMIVLLIVVAVILVLAMLTSKRLYSPVSRLITQVAVVGVETEEVNKNEMEFIAKRIDHLVGKNAMLGQLVISQQKQLIELFWVRLLRGEIRHEEVEGYMKSLGIPCHPFYAVVVIILKSQDETETYDEAEQDALRLDVVSSMPNETVELLHMPAMYFGKAICSCVGGDNKNKLEENVMKLYEILDLHIWEKYQFHISMGVSGIHGDMTEFLPAYHESTEALKENEILNITRYKVDKSEKTVPGGIMFYSDIVREEYGYGYDRTREREIKDAIDHGDKEETFKAIDSFIEEIYHKKVTQSEAALHLQRLMVAILLCVTDAGIPLERIFGGGTSTLFINISQIYDMDKVRGYLKYKISEPVINSLSEERVSKSNSLIGQIQKLIEVRDGDITLTECADILGYHPTYLWKIMKMEKSINFSDYVGNYKLEEAKRLLLETDMTVNEIAIQLKYTNAQNFIRFFSKLEGITPGKFRQVNRMK